MAFGIVQRVYTYCSCIPELDLGQQKFKGQHCVHVVSQQKAPNKRTSVNKSEISMLISKCLCMQAIVFPH